ncbi:hypothetical protein [Ruegeria atlantica]|uniref:hypothetical protein n=1 Tax=Ruegeria atlantica TaxID=81569 RepID=UPI001479AF75|nr:hypothetical protein [Ruegeria atlantica]
MKRENPIPEWLQWVLLLLALVTFGLMVWHLWFDRTASAGTAAAIGFGLLLFRILPDLESFQILGLQAKLRERIAEADELLNQLRQITAAQSRVAMLTLAYSNRMGGMSNSEKNQTYEALLQRLREVGLEKGEIALIVEPVLRMISRDLLAVFTSALSEVVGRYGKLYQNRGQELERELSDVSPGERQKQLESIFARQRGYKTTPLSEVFSKGLDYKSIAEVGRELMDNYRLSDEDRDVLNEVLREVAEISAKVWSRQTVDADTLSFIAEFSGRTTTSFNKYFPEGINGPTWKIE